MKTRIKSFVSFLIIAFLTISPLVLNAQGGDPPPPPGEHSQNGNQPPGGGTPIGSGMVILLALGAVYGGKKMWKWRILKP